jgi:hypothetical protein
MMVTLENDGHSDMYQQIESRRQTDLPRGVLGMLKACTYNRAM